jgi:hypothetical protein
MTPRRTAALLVAGLVLTLLLGLALQPAVRDAIALPIAYAGWLVGLVFNSIPGVIWWAWLLVVMLVILGRSVRGRRESSEPARIERPVREGPVSIWFRRVHLSRDSDYFRWRLAYDLGRLALGMDAYREGLSTTRVGRHHVELDGPPEIVAYLNAGLGSGPEEATGMPASLIDVPGWLRDLWRNRRKPARRRSPLALPPEHALAYLEKELE